MDISSHEWLLFLDYFHASAKLYIAICKHDISLPSLRLRCISALQQYIYTTVCREWLYTWIDMRNYGIQRQEFESPDYNHRIGVFRVVRKLRSSWMSWSWSLITACSGMAKLASRAWESFFQVPSKNPDFRGMPVECLRAFEKEFLRPTLALIVLKHVAFSSNKAVSDVERRLELLLPLVPVVVLAGTEKQSR